MSKVGLSAIRQDPLALVGFDPVKQLSMRRKPILVTFLHSVAMFTWLHYQRAQTKSKNNGFTPKRSLLYLYYI